MEDNKILKVSKVDMILYQNPKIDEMIGCNKVWYYVIQIGISNGLLISGVSCRCTKGCNGTLRAPFLGMKFPNVNELFGYLFRTKITFESKTLKDVENLERRRKNISKT